MALEKSFSNESKDENMETVIQKKMDEGMTMAQAMTFAKTQK